MKTKTISILGCGWLGLPLAKHLISKQYKIKGSTRSQEKNSHLLKNGISPFNINISDLNNEMLLFLKSEILICAIPSKDINAFKTLIQSIEKSSIKNVIFISSSSVYPANNNTITELDQINDGPIAIIENLFLSSPQFKTTILRFGGLIGPNRNPGNFFNNGKKLKAVNHPVNMIHLRDCIGIIEQIILQKKWNTILNACADSHPTKGDFYGKMLEITHQKKLETDQINTTNFKIISNKKLKEQLNYTFIHPDLMLLTLDDF